MAPPDSHSSSGMSSCDSATAESLPDAVKHHQEKTGFIFLSMARMPSTIFMLTFFVPYLTLLAKHSINVSGSVSLYFTSMKPVTVPLVAILVASVCSAIFCPVLGALADFSPHRRSLLRGFALCSGIVFCLVVIVAQETWCIGFFLLIVMFFSGQAADFLSNSYLAEVADTPAQRSKVSGTALRLGLLSQVMLLLVGTTVSYFFVPYPLQPNGSQFECSTSNGFATIRAFSFDDFESAKLSLTTAGTIEQNWHGVLDESVGPAKKLTSTKFLVVTSARIRVDPLDSGSTFVAFSEKSEGVELHGRKVAINAVIQPEGEAGRPTEVRLHLLTFSKDRKNAHLLSDDKFTRLDTTGSAERAFTMGRSLPPDAHHLYYIIEMKGGPASITRLDVMDNVTFIVPTLMLMTGIWYLIWSVMGLRRLGERNPRHAANLSFPSLILKSVVGLGRTMKRTASDSVLTRSLLAVAFYSASAGSTMFMSSLFMTEKLEISQFMITIATLATIGTSILGAFLFILMGKRIGYNRALSLAFLLWMFDLILMFFVLRERDDVGRLVITVPLMGIATGGSLALARAVFASQIPPGLECELFGLFSFGQSFMGPFALILFLAANEILGDMQWGIASQSIFMFLAFALQFSIREEDIASRHTSDRSHHTSPNCQPMKVISVGEGRIAKGSNVADDQRIAC